MSKIIMLLPLVALMIISLPLIPVFQGKKTARSAKIRMSAHIALFFVVIGVTLAVELNHADVFAAEEAGNGVSSIVGTNAQGMGFLAAALATGLSALGAGIAVAAAAPAAIGAFSENSKNFGKSLIIVALGEGVAIYGLLISILIIMLKL